MIKALIFDWGNTIMRDFPEKKGPMYLWDKVEWIHGAEEALKILYNKHIMVIATNAGDSNTDAMIKALKRVQADKYFHYFFSSKDLGWAKPDKRFFLSIAEKIKIHPQECVMIGNDYEKDIVGAKKCGFITVLFSETGPKKSFPDADFIIENMELLPEIFRKIH